LGLVSFVVVMPMLAFASTAVFDELFRLVGIMLRAMGRVQ